MTEPNTADQGGQQQQDQQTQPQTFVGKYQTQEAFEQGIRENARVAGKPLPDDGPLIGEDGRFKSMSEAVAAYKAFSRMRTRGDGEQQGGDIVEQPPVDDTGLPAIPAAGDTPNADMDAAAVLEAAGLRNDEIVNQWTTNGKLTDEQYTKLQAALPGVSRQMIDRHLTAEQMAAAHVTHVRAGIQAEAAKIAGGEQQLQTLLAGARHFVPADEIEGINEMLADPKRFKVGLRLVMDHKRRHLGADKSQPTINSNGGGGSGQPLRRGTSEYFATVRAAGRGDEAAKQRLRQLANG